MIHTMYIYRLVRVEIQEVVRILTNPIAGDVAQWVRARAADAPVPGSSPWAAEVVGFMGILTLQHCIVFNVYI